MAAPLTPVAGRRLLFIMAHAAEYGPHLRARFTPLFTGVGPVEAAVTTTAALAGLQAAGKLPDLVVCLGSAGSARLEQCGVYQVASVAWRDMDASALGFAPGATPFLDLPVPLPVLCALPGLPVASLSTGGNVVSGAGYDALSEDMVDMETYAVLRACQRFDVPLIGLRGISDGKTELTGLQDWTAALPNLDARLADAVDLIAPAIHSGAVITGQSIAPEG